MLELQVEPRLPDKKRRAEEATTLTQPSKRQCSAENSIKECSTTSQSCCDPVEDSKSLITQELAALESMSYTSAATTEKDREDTAKIGSVDSTSQSLPASCVDADASRPSADHSKVTLTKGKKRTRKQQPVALPMSPMAIDRLLLLGELLLQGVDASWRNLIEKKLYSFDGLTLLHKYAEELSRKTVTLPPMNLVFEAFRLSKFDKTRVIILGQDPYHRVGQAMGLAFSVPRTLKKLPPSLKNIYAELGLQNVGHGDLTSWAAQGVLLLNPVLTVSEGQPNSHASMGWQGLTDQIIASLAQEGGKVFMLWGEKAKAKLPLIPQENNLCLQSAHPSPLATRGDFKGCGHFRLCNEYLKRMGSTEIRWESVCDDL